MDFGVDEFGRPLVSGYNAARPTSHEVDEASSQSSTPRQHDDATQANQRLDSDSDDFSDDVEIVHGEEAQDDITQGLVAAEDETPSSSSRMLLLNDVVMAKDSSFTTFLDLVANIPQRQRSIGLVGALHHGKSSLLAMLAAGGDSPSSPPAYSQRRDELQRLISIKTNLSQVVLSGSTLGVTPSHLVTLVDTPGHPELVSEVSAGIRLVDCVLLCVDAVEGVIGHTSRLIKLAALDRLPIVLVITKIDRLLLELRLPPMDTYRKLREIIDSVNNDIATFSAFATTSTPSDADDAASPTRSSLSYVHPIGGTVVFTSTRLKLAFTLETFAQKYCAHHRSRVHPAALAKRLWGPFTYDNVSRTFGPASGQQHPSFVQFVLEPLYKAVACAVTGNGQNLLHSTALSAHPASPLTAASEATQFFFGDAHQDLVSAVLNVCPMSAKRLADLNSLSRATQIAEGGCVALLSLHRIYNMSAQAKVTASSSVTNNAALKHTYSIVRVIRGTLRAKTPCAAMDNRMDATTDEPYLVTSIADMMLKTPEGLVEVRVAHEGQVVLVRGLSDRLHGNAILYQSADGIIEESREDCFDALNNLLVVPLHVEEPRVQITLEPVEPKALPVVRQAMQTLLRTSPGLDIRAEETGEYTLSGFGEVHLDSICYDLRSVLCHDIPLKISAPFVSFSETVTAHRGILAMAGTSHLSRSQVGFVSGALSPQISQLLESGQLNPVPSTSEGKRALWTLLHRDHHWDLLDSRNVIACGYSQTKGSSLLINDMLDEDVLAQGSQVGSSLRHAVVEGFQNALRSGPLCGEPLRQIRTSLIHLAIEDDLQSQISSSVVSRRNTAAQIAIQARQAVTQSLFGARLALMEPVYVVDILAVPWRMDAVREILQMRRGAVLSEKPIAATPLLDVKAYLPMMDSFGFETQLRMTTVGEVFCTMSFDHWDVVPGDPLDDTVHLEPLEPARGFQLARDFVMKTRFRKGLASDVSVPI